MAHHSRTLAARIACLCAVAPAVLAGGAEPETLTADQIFDRTSAAVVRVEFQDGSRHVVGRCSGFFVSRDGVLITESRFLGSSRTARVVLRNNAAFDLTLAHSPVHLAGLTVLKVPGKNLAHVSLPRTTPTQAGGRVFAIAAPPGYSNTISQGIVNGVLDEREGSPLMRISAEVDDDSAGGPVLDSAGALIGVAVKLPGQRGTFAVPASDIRRLLVARVNRRAVATSSPLPPEPTPAPLTPGPLGPAYGVAGFTPSTPEPTARSLGPFASPPTLVVAAEPAPVRQRPAVAAADPAEPAASAPLTEVEQRAARALAPFAGTRLQPTDGMALSVGLRLAALREKVDHLADTLENLQHRALDLSGDAVAVARRTDSPEREDAALSASLAASQAAFRARHTARTYRSLDTIYDYERYLGYGGIEDFFMFLRAQQVASIPPYLLRPVPGVGSGWGLSVTPPLRVTNSPRRPRPVAPSESEDTGPESSF